MSARNPDREQGFILIAATWLLLLLGAIAAVSVLRSVHASRETRAIEDQLRQRLALESAAETVIASHLFDGPGGRWALLPASGAVTVEGVDIGIVLTSEAGRLDLNDTSARTIEEALQGLGVDADARRAFMSALQARRAGERIAHNAELLQLIAPLKMPESGCADDLFTLYSGLAEPKAIAMGTALAKALKKADMQSTFQPSSGEPLRVALRPHAGGAVSIVFRKSLDHGYQMVSRSRCQR